MKVTTENIWMEFHQEMRSFIMGKVADPNDADDILQDVFVKMLAKADKIAQAESVQKYIHAITRNAVNDHFRKVKRQTIHESEFPIFTDDESQSLNATIADCCIKPFIAQLPQKYQEALVKTEFENLSQKELASQLNISYSGAKSRVQRGKEKLKQLILTCCDFPSDNYGNLQAPKSMNCNCE